MNLLNECADVVYDNHQNRTNPWAGTRYEKHYELDNKQKGSKGEEILEALFVKLGCQVEKPLNTDHDRLVNGLKLECKFSLAQKDTRVGREGKVRPNWWMLNHVAEGKDWEWLCFAGVNPEGHDPVVRMLSKDKFKELKRNEKEFDKYFSPQQGGKKAANDDWMTGTTKLNDLLNSKYVIGVDEWLQTYA